MSALLRTYEVTFAETTQNLNFGIKEETAATFLQTNGVEHGLVQSANPIEPTAIAAEGRKQTVQVVCFLN
jgi:hypothetical protein